MMIVVRIGHLVSLLLLALALLGCGGRVGAEAELTTNPTTPNLALATLTPMPATATLPLTSTPPASATTLPSVTPLPTATNTPPPPATATATPTATATVTPLSPTPTTTATATTSTGTEPHPTPWPTPDGPLTYEERVFLFDELWKLVNERYIDPNFNGVNWAAQYDYYRPRALNAPNDTAYYQELKQMVWDLNDAHSRFMTPDEAFQHFALTRNEVTYGGLGLYTMPLPDGALVLQVMPGSPAARAGVRACDRITAIDGGGYWGDGGAVGTTSVVDFQRPGGDAYSVTMTREVILQVLEVPGFVLPNRAQRIGYVRIDTLWVFDIPQRLRARLAEIEVGGPLDGLIIDLRPNEGGWRPVLRSILGTFVAGTLGEFYGQLDNDLLVTPDDEEPPPAYPNLPLVVLVGPRTESYAEVLAATLQAERGATVLGQGTKGNVETIYPRRLPYGARVWIAEQGFRLNNGNALEGIGVQPNVWDNTDWTRYACGYDPQVIRAAEILEGQ